MDNLVENTLSAWALIETLQPGEVEGNGDYLSPKLFEQNESQKVIHNFETYKSIWTEEIFNLKEYAAKNGQLQYQMYRYCFKFGEIEKAIREMFDDEEVYNESQTDCYGYTFMVDQQGKVSTDTIYVPMLMSAMKSLKKNRNSDIEEVYYHNLERFKLECEEILGDNILTEAKLQKMDKLYLKYFEYYETPFSRFFKHAVAVRYVKPDDQTDELNSFYLTDIEESKKEPNAALKKYINGLTDKERCEVDENRAFIEDILKPENYPDGRWPSIVDHRLSLMQQVAVNQITSGKDKINSVNGPPGTGKTTLLKDIFAHNIVERAKELVKLSSPSKAFKYEKIHDTDQYKTAFLNDNLTRFKMVVASSNNGAVENISKDAPKIEEVVRKEKKSKFLEYEQAYQEAAEKLEDFGLLAEKIINEPAWSLFSGVFGKKKNIDEAMKYILTDKDETLVKKLIQLKTELDIDKEWKASKKAFNQTLEKVTGLKQDIAKDIRLNAQYQKNKSKIKDLEASKAHCKQSQSEIQNKLKQLKDQKEKASIKLSEQQDRIANLEKIEAQNKQASFTDKLKQLFNPKAEDEIHSENQDKLIQLLEEKEKLYGERENTNTEIQALENREQENRLQIEQDEQQIEKLKAELTYSETSGDVQFSDDAFWQKDNYKVRQDEVLNTSDELQFYRGLLFIQAMCLHRLLLIGNAKAIQSSLYDFVRRNEYIKSTPIKVENAWNVLHLVYPVISTTFASFRNMYRTMPKDFIDYLYIDEAGQAVPQAAVGAIQRSRNVVVVGDPIQIEPVVTLDHNLINSVRKAFNVPERLVSAEASVQSLADNANPYGYWKGNASGDKEWIGIPLWVHRRCLNPMFTISNIIAYEQKMVLPSEIEENPGQSSWLDVKGKAEPKQFVKAQGEQVVKYLVEDWKAALNNEESAPSSFVISPFTKVKSEIQKLARHHLPSELGIEYKKVNTWINDSIGTVHTFQGKEADKVYFVTGTDEDQNGAIKWSCQKPNLINVAVTRAKEEFVIVGDKERISKLEYYDVIAEQVSQNQS